jgi:hypothetical protein
MTEKKNDKNLYSHTNGFFIYIFFIFKKTTEFLFPFFIIFFFFFSGSHALGDAGLPQFGSQIVRLFYLIILTSKYQNLFVK